ncbi:MAG: serine/threonine-protein phosphatase [Clostridia bacterium]|nr:serine/threonine-protein phosphatase [Clostridia bacterium]
MSESLVYKFSSKIHQGNREEQQDYVCIEEKNGVLLSVVCDGMGGLENGAEASRIAAEKLSDLFRKKDETKNIPDFFLECVDIMDESVYNLSIKEGNRTATGTTVVTACVKDDNLYWMSVGDSRLYLIRNNEIEAATRDHNYFMVLEEMQRNNIPEELCIAEEEKRGDALVSFIGMGGIELMDIISEPFRLMKSDKILLTSDGLYKLLSEEKIKEIILANDDVDVATDKLIEAALSVPENYKDNISIVLISMEEKI